jgi:hypothetical protein
MQVLVRVKLLRQFAVELGKLLLLHLAEAGDEHVVRRCDEFKHQEDLFHVIRMV